MIVQVLLRVGPPKMISISDRRRRTAECRSCNCTDSDATHSPSLPSPSFPLLKGAFENVFGSDVVLTSFLSSSLLFDPPPFLTHIMESRGGEQKRPRSLSLLRRLRCEHFFDVPLASFSLRNHHALQTAAVSSVQFVLRVFS